MSSSQSPSRGGNYRDRALDYYGRFCQECTWSPTTDAEEHKLHVHHETPDGDGGPDAVENLTVLCRDCHLERHSESAFSHELVGRLTNALEDALSHKRDGFGSRVARRVRLDTIYLLDGNPPENFANTSTDYVLIEGITEGDHYDSYFVDTDQPYLSMCSCYTHSFGVHRAHQICTHVGAALVRRAIKVVKQDGEEAALRYIQTKGTELDTKAQDYIQKQELVQEGIDTLDIEERFSESWAQRAQGQAKKMTQYGSEWKCFGSECEGCEVRLTADGFTCSDAQDKGWAEKYPCPGKLGAYILNETDGQTVSPDIDAGHIFKMTRSRGDIPVSSSAHFVVTDVNDDAETTTFRTIETESQFTLDYDVLTDAIMAGTLETVNKTAITRYNNQVRLVEDQGVPVGLAPNIEAKDVFHVQTDSLSSLAAGDTISVVGLNDEMRTVTVEKAVPDHPFGGPEVELSYTDFRDCWNDGQLESGYISDVFDIIATDVVSAYNTKKVVFYSPKSSKEDFNALDWQRAKQDWNDTVEYKWCVDGQEIDYVVDHLQDGGWNVWIPTDVRSEIADIQKH